MWGERTWYTSYLIHIQPSKEMFLLTKKSCNYKNFNEVGKSWMLNIFLMGLKKVSSGYFIQKRNSIPKFIPFFSHRTSRRTKNINLPHSYTESRKFFLLFKYFIIWRKKLRWKTKHLEFYFTSLCSKPEHILKS